jgi:hypothetical protein
VTSDLALYLTLAGALLLVAVIVGVSLVTTGRRKPIEEERQAPGRAIR